jgi:serine/threonine protein kinase
LGLGGNPYADDLPALAAARAKLADCRLDPGDYVLGAVLGSGASGVVRRADRPGQPDRAWAVKCFKSMLSDGNPEDELDIAAAAAQGAIPPGILPFRGWFPAPALSMVMDFVDDADPLGLVPSLESITRDCYPADRRFTPDEIRGILATMARAQEHLIACRVVHGDFYAHNILANRQGGVWLGDWGASFFMGNGDGWMEKLEVRAFGCLAEELLERCREPDPALAALRDRCLEDETARRPGFRELAAALGN